MGWAGTDSSEVMVEGNFPSQSHQLYKDKGRQLAPFLLSFRLIKRTAPVTRQLPESLTVMRNGDPSALFHQSDSADAQAAKR